MTDVPDPGPREAALPPRAEGSAQGPVAREGPASEPRWVPAALFCAVADFHAVTLLRYPSPFVDEAWLASRATGLLRTGRNFGVLDAGVFDRFDGYWTFFPWIPSWLQAQALRWFSDPSLLAVRLVSLAFGLILLAAIYSIARRLAGTRAALLSVILLSLSKPFLYSAHLARYDIMITALGFAAIALFLRETRRPWLSGLLAGLLLGIGFEIHLNAVIYGLAIVALGIVRSRWSLFRQARFWGLVAGSAAGLAGYLLFHVARYPDTYFALQRLVFSPTHNPPLLTLDPVVMLASIADGGRLIWDVYRVMTPLVLFALLALVRKGADDDVALIVLAVSVFFFQALLIRNRPLYYAILLTPAFDLLLGAYLADLLRWPQRRSIVGLGGRLLAVSLCVATIVMTLLPLSANGTQACREVEEKIRGVAKPGESIMAPQTYWFGLHDHPYRSWEMLIYYWRYKPQATLEDALREFHPDLFIVDGHLEFFISDDPGSSAYLRGLSLPRTELASFLGRHASLVDDFDGGPYGRVRVFRFDWTR